MTPSQSRIGAESAISRKRQTTTRAAIETLSRRSLDFAICQGERPTILTVSAFISGETGGASASNRPALIVMLDELLLVVFPSA